MAGLVTGWTRTPCLPSRVHPTRLESPRSSGPRPSPPERHPTSVSSVESDGRWTGGPGSEGITRCWKGGPGSRDEDDRGRLESTQVRGPPVPPTRRAHRGRVSTTRSRAIPKQCPYLPHPQPPLPPSGTAAEDRVGGPGEVAPKRRGRDRGGVGRGGTALGPRRAWCFRRVWRRRGGSGERGGRIGPGRREAPSRRWG